jgi:predicted nucleic acid-binding protein
VKAVFDTNVLIAAFLTEGLCSGLLIRARRHAFNLILSDDILQEFKGILTKKFKLSSSDISEITAIVTEAASEILPKPGSFRHLQLFDAGGLRTAAFVHCGKTPDT